MCMDLTQVNIQKAKVRKKNLRFLTKQMIPSYCAGMWVTFTSVQYLNNPRRCLVGRGIT